MPLARRSLPTYRYATCAPKPNRYLKLFGDGFGVRVSPSGQKTFVFWFSYRGKKQLLTLGRYPAVPLKEALAKHATARNAVLRGENPAAADRDAAYGELAGRGVRTGGAG